MTKRISILCVWLLLVVLAWWHWPRATAPTGSPFPKLTSTDRTLVATKTQSASPVRLDLEMQLRRTMNDANRPIDFFGQVIDQNGNPIPEVEVTLAVRYTKEIGPVNIADTFDHPVLATDRNGLFSLHGAKGAMLSVASLKKEGYESSEKSLRRSFWYWAEPNPYRADPTSPEVFRMWKKSGAEKLVRRGLGRGLRYDGTPTDFDLLNGENVTHSDLRVALVRNPLKIEWGQRNYEWTAIVEALDGGIMVSADEQMYEAPPDDYQPKLVIHVPAGDPNWTDEKVVSVYLKLRKGRFFGRAELRFMVGAVQEVTPFNMTSFVNPSGSRNLEYDRLQDVEPLPSAGKPSP
jgi:hypothetical protein